MDDSNEARTEISHAAAGTVDAARIEGDVIDVLRTVYDPKIPVDIYELGLIYGVKVNPKGEVDIRMALTSTACAVAGTLPGGHDVRGRAGEAGLLLARGPLKTFPTGPARRHWSMSR